MELRSFHHCLWNETILCNWKYHLWKCESRHIFIMLIVLFQVLRMSSKRPAEDQGGGSSSGPPAKKLLTRFEPVRIGTIGNLVSFFFCKRNWILCNINNCNNYFCSWFFNPSLFKYLQEELDMKVLRFQNKKLVERIEQRKRSEDELKRRIDSLENRQRTDDAVLMIVNRYWNQVRELILFTLWFGLKECFENLVSKSSLKN